MQNELYVLYLFEIIILFDNNIDLVVFILFYLILGEGGSHPTIFLTNIFWVYGGPSYDITTIASSIRGLPGGSPTSLGHDDLLVSLPH